MSSLDKSVDTVVREARRLRDYMLYTGEIGDEVLTAALWPFEAKANGRPTETQVGQLFKAFQAAQHEALARIDAYTLNEVLRGRSPQQERSLTLTAFFVAASAVVLVVFAYTYSNWVSRTERALADAQDFIEFDHFGQVMKLVELEYYFDAAVTEGLPADLEPEVVYLEGIAALTTQYSKENEIQSRLAVLEIEYRPVLSTLSKLRRAACGPALPPVRATPPPDDAATSVAASGDRRQPSPAAASMVTADGQPWRMIFLCDLAQRRTAAALAREVDGAGTDHAEASASRPTPRFRGRLEEIDRRQDNTMDSAGRPPELSQDYFRSVQNVRRKSLDLGANLDTVQRWTLPLIYGMLGSVVYCMWRVLSPNVAPLGFIHFALRTAFAGLAALTLSMLFIPSNTLGLGDGTSKPLIYLVSFIFGYSIEAFVSTLNNLNRYLATRLAPKEGGASAG